jgi:hypothetical protein
MQTQEGGEGIITIMDVFHVGLKGIKIKIIHVV